MDTLIPASLGFLLAPIRGRASESRLECPCERLARSEADRQCDVQNGQPGLRGKPHRRQFEPPPAQVVAECFTRPGREQSVEVKGREVRNPGQLAQLERLLEVQV